MEKGFEIQYKGKQQDKYLKKKNLSKKKMVKENNKQQKKDNATQKGLIL